MERGSYFAGLEALGNAHSLLETVTDVAVATLNDYGHPVERRSQPDRTTVRITATHYVIRLKVSALPGPGAAKRRKLSIDMIAADPERDDRDISELLMVVLLYRAVSELKVVQVEWLTPENAMSVNDFLHAFSAVPKKLVRAGQPDRVMSKPRFAPVDDTLEQIEGKIGVDTSMFGRRTALWSDEDTLTIAMRENRFGASDRAKPEPAEEEQEEERPSDVQRLGIWAMTGTLAFISAPVAASLAAVNLLRGEDLRLNTHVLALTVFLATMQSSGALASAVSRLPL